MLTNFERKLVDFCPNDIEAKSSFLLFEAAEKSAAKRLFAFSTFYNHYKVASYGDEKRAELLSNKDIIRNRLKIDVSIKNSRIFKEIQAEFGSFAGYIWSFTKGDIIFEDYTFRTTSPISDEISRDLKARGMTFVGSTIIYSYLQAIGVINGHSADCAFYKKH